MARIAMLEGIYLERLHTSDVVIGDSLDIMLQKLGDTADVGSSTHSNASITSYDYQYRTILVQDGTVVQIEEWAPTYETERGIGIHDSRSDAITAYSDDEYAVVNMHHLFTEIEGHVLDIEFEGGTVNKVIYMDKSLLAISPFEEAERYAGMPFPAGGFGSCQDRNVYRYVKEYFDPSIPVADASDPSTYAACSETKDSQVNEVHEETVSTVENDEEAAVPDLSGFEGQWGTPGSDELAFKLTIASDNSGVISFISEGEEYPSDIEFIHDGNKLKFNYAGADKITVLELVDGDSMVFENPEGVRLSLKRIIR